MARLRATAAKGELPDLASSHVLLEKVKPAAPAKANGKKTAGKNGAGKNGKGATAAEKLAANVVGTEEPKVEAPAPAAPAAAPADEAQADSWRVSTRQVIALLHEVERLREVRLRLEERRRELDKA